MNDCGGFPLFLTLPSLSLSFTVSIFLLYFLFIFVLVNSFYIFQFLFPVGPCSCFHREQRKETKRRQIEKEARRKKYLLNSFPLFLSSFPLPATNSFHINRNTFFPFLWHSIGQPMKTNEWREKMIQLGRG